MAQMVIYIENDIKQRIEKAAKSNHTSSSRWVKDVCLRQLEDEWPKELLDLYGSVKDDSLQRPEQVDPMYDASRESL